MYGGSYHAPAVKRNDAEHHCVEHYLRGEIEAFLDGPEAPDADELGGDADDEEVGQFERVIRYDGILQRRDHGHGCVEAVA